MFIEWDSVVCNHLVVWNAGVLLGVKQSPMVSLPSQLALGVERRSINSRIIPKQVCTCIKE